MSATSWERLLERLDEIQCPLDSSPECIHWFDRTALAVHLETVHPDYECDPEPYFTAYAERVYEGLRPDGGPCD